MTIRRRNLLQLAGPPRPRPCQCQRSHWIIQTARASSLALRRPGGDILGQLGPQWLSDHLGSRSSSKTRALP